MVIQAFIPAQTSVVVDRFVDSNSNHLGNTMLVLTDQSESQSYPPATVESSRISNEQLYYNIDPIKAVDKNSIWASGYSSFENNVYQVHGGLNGQKTGLEMILKVML